MYPNTITYGCWVGGGRGGQNGFGEWLVGGMVLGMQCAGGGGVDGIIAEVADAHVGGFAFCGGVNSD